MLAKLLPIVLLLGSTALAQDLSDAPPRDSDEFIEPKPGQWRDGVKTNYTQGQSLTIKFDTTIPDPQLLLFCSYINNPIIAVPIKPPTARTYTLNLDLAPQPNCYFQMQPKVNSTASIQPFVTSIFAIKEDPNFDGEIQGIYDANLCPVCSLSSRTEMNGNGFSSSVNCQIGNKKRRRSG